MELKPGYKQTEVGVIPEEWDLAPVRQKGEVLTGKALAVNAPGVQRPYLRTKNVFDGRIDINDVLTMPMTDEQFAQFQIRHGDILLNEGQSIELVGRCAMYQDEYPGPCAIQNALLRFRSRAGVSEKFASYLFRHCQHTGVFARIALQTTSVAHLGGSRFERLLLAWPTEPEQRAIADTLSDVDALMDGLNRLIAKKRDLKQAAMQQLLTGQTRLAGFNKKWEVKQLGNFGKCLRGVSYKGDSDLSTHDTINTRRLLRSNNVQNSIVVVDEVQFVNAARVSAQQILKKNDVLICMANGSKALVGKAGPFIVSDGHEYTFGAFMGCFRTNPAEANPAFVFYLFLTGRYRDYINNLLAGSSINNLTPSSIELLEFSMPPLPEQTAIAEVLTEMDAELAALEQRREKTRTLKQAMMQELLTGRTRLV
jgi:type I restriction enzyme S subunit